MTALDLPGAHPPFLSAEERALEVVRALKEDRPPDPAVRRTAPLSEYDEVNRLLAQAQATHAHDQVRRCVRPRTSYNATLLLSRRVFH